MRHKQKIKAKTAEKICGFLFADVSGLIVYATVEILGVVPQLVKVDEPSV